MRYTFQPRQIAHYVLSPGLVPRVRNLALNLDFSFLAYAFASCFDMVRLLPRGHAYLNPNNYGTFGLFDVLRAAAANLKFEWKHIDQILMFFGILAGLVAFSAFFILAGLYALTMPASAASPALYFSPSFHAPSYLPNNDIAYQLLDRVLGIQGSTPSGSFFGSDVPSEYTFWPTPFHIALHRLLAFYSNLLLFFAMLVFFYLIVILVYETNVTGVPMGSRFNKVWAPLRIVAAIGMLIPLPPHNLNGAQYIVLHTAKASSAFATNAWISYNNTTIMGMGVAGRNPIGSVTTTAGGIAQSNLAVKVTVPDVSLLLNFLHMVTTCEYFYERQHPGDGTPGSGWNIQGYFVVPNKPTFTAYGETVDFPPPSSSSDPPPTNVPTNYATALSHFNNGNITIVFGRYDTVAYPDLPGNVKPLCGELVIPITSVDDPTTTTLDNPGANIAQEYYYSYTLVLLDKSSPYRKYMDGFASLIVESNSDVQNADPCRWDTNGDKILDHQPTGGMTPTGGTPLDDASIGGPKKIPIRCDGPIDPLYRNAMIERWQSLFQILSNGAYAEIADANIWGIDNGVLERGWAGAGIWFNRIAKLNGPYITAASLLPYGSGLPMAADVMMRAKIMGAGGNISGFDMLKYELLRSDKPDKSKQSDPLTAEDKSFLKALNASYQYWYVGGNDSTFIPNLTGGLSCPPEPACGPVTGWPGITKSLPQDQKNGVINAMNMILATETIFDFKNNNDVHPFAKLIGLGRGLLEKSIRHLATGSSIAVMGGILAVGNEDVGSGVIKTSGFFFTFASIFFMAGFTLYYVVPFMPFIFFYFAVLSWVKAIFEALIGAPLWALAHLRLEGQGFPSGPSMGGYLLLLEIFLRPIITILALVGAMAFFSASVQMLNDLFDAVVYRMHDVVLGEIGTGTELTPPEYKAGPIDLFFYTITYIFLVYIFANSSFQLIDRIPNSFMRWFGGGMKSFSAEAYRRDSPASSYQYITGLTITRPVSDVIDDKVEGAMATVGGYAGGLAEKSSDGAISEMVHNTFGRSLSDRVQENLYGTTKTIRDPETGKQRQVEDMRSILLDKKGNPRTIEEAYAAYNRNELDGDEKKQFETMFEEARSLLLKGGSFGGSNLSDRRPAGHVYVQDREVLEFLKGVADPKTQSLAESILARQNALSEKSEQNKTLADKMRKDIERQQRESTKRAETLSGKLEDKQQKRTLDDAIKGKPKPSGDKK